MAVLVSELLRNRTSRSGECGLRLQSSWCGVQSWGLRLTFFLVAGPRF